MTTRKRKSSSRKKISRGSAKDAGQGNPNLQSNQEAEPWIPQFDIHASVVFQLGESLISDPGQALVELVKNSYDADADYAEVAVETTKSRGDKSEYPAASGYIMIKDDGDGMDLSAIRNGWLTISDSPKKSFKENKRITDKGRTPLGDKGLGRLGTQTLGENIEILTTPKNSKIRYHVSFSWRDFRDKSIVSSVPVKVTSKRSTEKGTELIISDLKDLNYWQKSARDLQGDLAKLISPYSEGREFIVVASVNETPIDLISYTEGVRDASHVRYTIEFDGEHLKIKGKTRIDFFKPDDQFEKLQFRSLVEEDEGDSFFTFLASRPRAKQFRLSKSTEPGWFAEYQTTRQFPLPEPKLIADIPANPGPFHGEIDSFNLGFESTASAYQKTLFKSAEEYKEYIKAMHGIKVYRDGFGIRVDTDWLHLGKQWTSAGSYYGLKPNNTIGFIAISARDNPQLEEKTDREGFRITPYYQNFEALLKEFVGFSGNAQQFIRREWISFRKANKEKAANVKPGTPPDVLSRGVASNLSKAAQFKSELVTLRQDQRHTIDDVGVTLDQVSAVLSKDAEPRAQMTSALRSLEQSCKTAATIIGRVENYLDDLADAKLKVEVLTENFSLLLEQRNEFYEAAGLGLAAEALSHEIQNVADQLASRTTKIQARLADSNGHDARLIAYTEFVITSVHALRKQLAHLAPSLRYIRERKDEIALRDFFEHEVMDYYRPLRFDKHDIDLTIETRANFSISMSQGKLTQVVDNLLLNSEYWLIQDLRLKRIEHGVIKIEIAKPFLRVSDNGLGIDPTVEDSLFEPFVTRKPLGKGRGLGLFIVRQFLSSDGSTITVLPKRNKFGRLYIFELNLTGALIKKHG